MERNPISWFEVPVLDMDRATKFYEGLFKIILDPHEIGDLKMAWFPMNEDWPGSGGTLAYHEMYTPSADGVIIYFTSRAGDINDELSRVEELGGKILTPRKSIGEHGFMALILDTEGNRIALHSRE